MKWGTGQSAAVARIATLTRSELESIGVTLDMARLWVRLYERVAAANPANGSAKGRASLMNYAAELLRDD
jgi:hypothetical protein